MHEHMRTLLNAYLDGELHGLRLQEVETHLKSCADCRNELKELRSLSNILRTEPDPKPIPVERFVSHLTLSLPRRTLRVQQHNPGALAGWLIPTGLMAAWFFVQTVLTLTNVASVAGSTGLLGNAASWLGGTQGTVWFVAATSMFSAGTTGSHPTLALFNSATILSTNLLFGFLWQATIVLLYWGWLVTWWIRRGSRSMNMQAA
jgi:anti-sigma factor RsiW